ncbi:MAG: Short chain dehydrogenase family protein [Brevundimonas sp.]|nr:Short chain dehydrogenase family protein [Brevundimonas sp.]
MIRDPRYETGVALVVGAGGGVGGAVARSLAANGADVALTYRNSRDATEAVAGAVREGGRQADLYQLDLTDMDGVARVVAEVAETRGGIHTVVYAAGPMLPFKYMSAVTPQEFADFLTNDTVAFFTLMHAAIPHLRESQGSVVAIHTTGLYRWPHKDGLSVVPKAGVESLLKGLAKEEGRFGVRFNGVALGVLDGGLFDKMVDAGQINQRFIDATIAAVPLGRLGRLEEVADAAAFLASSKAGYVTGNSIIVDGGFHL